MNYRAFPKTGTPVSEVSLGAEHLVGAGPKTTMDVISAAMDHGMNYMDLFMPGADVRDWIGAALKGRRDKMLVAGHLRSVTENGQDSRTFDVAHAQRHIEDLLRRLNTDYIDMLNLFYVDSDEEADRCLDERGLLGVARRMLESGQARMLGFSCHVPRVASRLIATGLFDGMMFSLNPAMDRMDADTPLEDQFENMGAILEAPQGFSAERFALYRQCEAMGTGIVVMKGYAAGLMLKQGMTPVQCIHYALTRPGVVTMAAGCRSVAEVEAAAAYSAATAEERDYTDILASRQWNAQGVCMYCNHCLPCPSHIDIAAVTRLLHRAQEGDTAARAEYLRLATNGGDCTTCGECASRCPFEVDSPGNMAKAHEVFSR